ncbi:MAG: hypothetical protein NC110_03950 [Ruminococcus sp.]|nr:hypothetical protein [Ruminococcus sp.]
MLKQGMKVLSIFMLVVLFVAGAIVPASAYGTIHGYKMIGGVGSSGKKTRYYWVNPNSFNSDWQQLAVNAMYDWCHTGTKGCGVYTSVWFARTTDQHSSVVDFQKDNDLGSFVYGKTTLYKTAGESSPVENPYTNKSNWVWAKCTINTYACNSGKSSSGKDISLTKVKKQAVFAHEVGHAFGLDDLLGNGNKSKLMYIGQYDCTALKPTADECKGVNSLYGGYNP